MWSQLILGIFFVLAFVSGLPRVVENIATRNYAGALGGLAVLFMGVACLILAKRSRVAILEAKEASRPTGEGQADNHL
jgi:hypothetical protein